MEWSKRRCHGVRVVTTAEVQSTSPAPILQEFRFLRRLRGPQWQPTSVVCAASTSTVTATVAAMIAILLSIIMMSAPGAATQAAHPSQAFSRASHSNDCDYDGICWHGGDSVPTQTDRSEVPRRKHRTTGSQSDALPLNGPSAGASVPPTTKRSNIISPEVRRRGNNLLTGRLSNSIMTDRMSLNGSGMNPAAPARRLRLHAGGRSHHSGVWDHDAGDSSEIRLKQCECHGVLVDLL